MIHILTWSPALPDGEFLLSIRNKNSRKHEGSFPCNHEWKLNYVLDITGSHTPDEKNRFSFVCSEYY